MPAEAAAAMSATGEGSLPSFPSNEPVGPEPARRLAITIIAEAGDWTGFGDVEEAVARAGAAVAADPHVPIAAGSEANVVLASDALVRGLNGRYRGKDAPTNVLSFPFQMPPGSDPHCATLLGDVVLACETVAREAAEQAIAPGHHLQHLVVHGLLHLLGYDHQDDTEAEAMERMETEILGRIGIADPHAALA
jgi:probable rRNA maturation factor